MPSSVREFLGVRRGLSASPDKRTKPMRSVKFLMAAGAASLLSPAALAADMPSIMPPPQYYAPPAADFGGWYLRGDIGMTNQRLKSLNNPDPTVVNATPPAGMAFDSGMLFGLGVGYQVNNWLRFDVTGQYRGRANFHGSQAVVYNYGGGSPLIAEQFLWAACNMLFIVHPH